jgi:hypothetical protein
MCFLFVARTYLGVSSESSAESITPSESLLASHNGLAEQLSRSTILSDSPTTNIYHSEGHGLEVPNLTVLTFPSELQTPRYGYPTSHFPVGGFRTMYYKASVNDRTIAQVLRATLEVMSFTRYGPLIPSIAFLLW